MEVRSHAAVSPRALESILACPLCRQATLSFGARVQCNSCKRTFHDSDGIYDFVDESRLDKHDHEELQAQSNAVSEYYENEDKLACQWDRISARELSKLLGDPQGMVLDLGCGSGTAGTTFRRPGASVVGADLSMACLRAASKRLDAVVRANGAHLPFRDASFDAIISRGALHHMSSPGLALAEAARTLKPGGRVLFADPREFALLEPIKNALRRRDASFTDDHHAFPKDEYEKLISEFFDVEQCVTLYPFGILVAVGMDLLPLPKVLPKQLMSEALFRLDQALNRTPVGMFGHLVVVVARHR